VNIGKEVKKKQVSNEKQCFGVHSARMVRGRDEEVKGDNNKV
jgi:hypothetical protein